MEKPSMRPQPKRRIIFWFMLCTFMLLLAATAGFSTSQGASTDAPPLPVNVPMPTSVLFTDNFGKSMAIDGDILVVGAPWTDVNGAEDQELAYIYTRDANDP